MLNDFTFCQDAQPIQDAAASNVVAALNKWEFTYFDLAEQIYSDLEKQFQSQLILVCATIKIWTNAFCTLPSLIKQNNLNRKQSAMRSTLSRRK